MRARKPENEPERLAALRDYAVLDTAGEQVYDDITAMAAHICDVPMAMISFVDAERQWFKSRVGIETQETPRDIAFCAHTILDVTPMIVADALEDERFADNPLVLEQPKIRFYAGFPVIAPGGLPMGALCAIDSQPRQLSSAQQLAMTALSRQLVHILELRRLSARLATALDTIKTLEGLIPICAWCKRIRDDRGYWNNLEVYLSRHTEADFTHGICPDCIQKVHPGEMA